MEFGDIIYFILLVFFMILGFFNDSRKKKRQKQLLEEEAARPNLDARGEEITPPVASRPIVPPAKMARKSDERTVFQSSLDQLPDYKKYDTGEEIDFDYDADSFNLYGEEEGTPMLHQPMSKGSMVGGSMLSSSISNHSMSPRGEQPPVPTSPVNRRTSDGKGRGAPHPYLVDLFRDDRVEALKKGFIYSEILQRKY